MSGNNTPDHSDQAPEQVINGEETSKPLQGQVDDFNSRLNYVVLNDKTPLNNLIVEISKLGNHYTIDSWNRLQTELNSAITVRDNGNATQTEIIIAATNLQIAQNALVNIRILNSYISEAISLNPTNITPDSWKSIQTALEHAKIVRDKSNATQSEIDTEATNLQNAHKGLRLNRDKRELRNIIHESFNCCSPQYYTSGSWLALNNCIKKARSVIDNNDATQSEIDTEATNLQNAINGIVNIKDLVDIIKSTPVITNTGLTLNNLQMRLYEAITVRHNPDASVLEVTEVITNLKNAIRDLNN